MPPYRTASSRKEKQVRPVIIKKVRRTRQEAPHSSAWKVAYADFVTAMMAFFLLLWLLSTSSKATLQGIAEYFTPTTGLADKLPLSSRDAASPSSMQSKDPGINLSSPGLMQNQAGSFVGLDKPAQVDGEADRDLFARGETAMSQAIAQDPVLAQYQENINIYQTPEGLRIDLKDTEGHAMFRAGSTALSDHGKAILTRLVPLIKRLPNYMAITGYTDSSMADGANGLGRWALSSGRADAALQFMVASGMQAERPVRVEGSADLLLLNGVAPRSEQNRRASLLLMRGSHMLIPESAVPSAAPDNNVPAQ